MNYNVKTLNNGLRIIHLPSNSQVVYCGYAINAGSRNEQDTEQGIAHFCEHMTFKGTERLTPIRIINSLECVGGDLNAFTTKEDTFYYAAIHKDHFSRAVDVLTDIVFHSTYPQQEIDKEVEVVCDEIDSYRDSPAELIYDEFENFVFKGHPLGHNVLGESERVREFKTKDCKSFTSRYYVPSNAVFYALGDIDFNKLVDNLSPLTPQGGILDSTETIKEPRFCDMGGTCETMEQDTHQTHVMIGTVIPKSSQPSEDIIIDSNNTIKSSPLGGWGALFLLNNILGGPAMSSRLNLSLREKRGLVYTVESVMTNYSDALLWSVYFGCDSHDAKRCISLVQKELKRFIDKPMTESALKAAKRQLKGQVTLASENKENFAIDMAKQYLHKGTLKDNEELFQRIDNVTSECIHDLARTYLTPEKLFTLTFK